MKKTATGKNTFLQVSARNAFVPVQTHQIKQQEMHVRSSKKKKPEDKKEEAGASSTSVTEQKDLSLPQFSTILQLANDIENIKLNHKLLDSSNIGKNVAPNVNVKADERVFSDLVSLDKPNNKLEPIRKPTIPLKSSGVKDLEPDYNKLLTYSLKPEYKFTRISVPEVEKPAPEFDGRSIYRLTRRWDNKDIEYML